MSLVTSYEFTLPRGYVDPQGGVHRVGTMRLATARDELEPLRDPTVNGPDDPRLTVLILARVVQSLGDLPMVTPHEIEGLFAADLAFLQDFYGVINFGNQEEYEALLAAQEQSPPLAGSRPVPSTTRPTEPAPVAETDTDSDPTAATNGSGPPRPSVRAKVEEIPRQA